VDTKVMVSLFYVLGGYKGYGLSMMVELFCGIMSGGQFGPFIRQWKDFERPANLVSRKKSVYDNVTFWSNYRILRII
jgi:LDH2 family malate/lactate/ureidoglycolate dehydrogenase